MHFILLQISVILLINTAGALAKTAYYNETTPYGTIASDAPNVAALEINAYLQHKLESITDVLSQVETAVKGLQEKAHNWAIFHHHIDAWNEQLKSLEHKILLLQRSHDEQQTHGDKLIRIELTLNNVYSKVLYLSDMCFDKQQQQQRQAANVAQQMHDDEIVDLLHELQQHGAGDKKTRSEILTRLGNILHHVLKIESEHCSRVSQKKHNKAVADGVQGNYSDEHLARIMLPVGGCNATQRYHYSLDQTLKVMEQHLAVLTMDRNAKDFKQLHTLTKKNTRTLDEIVHSLAETDRSLENWQELANNQTRILQQHCQSVSDEVADSSESSVLLLKRIERIVGEVNQKLERLSQLQEKAAERNDHCKDTAGVSDGVTGENVTISNDDEPEGSNDDMSGFYEKGDIGASGASGDIEYHKQPSQINFVQPDKIGCHELNDRVDGIYKLSSPELNEDERDFNERFCAFATDGIAWTVIQNRGPYGEQESFNRSWSEYRNGFGQLNKDFWFGTEFVHQLVYTDDYELRIEMEDFDGLKAWAEYATFRLDSESYNYNLLIGGYRGSVPDALQYHNGIDFSTYDRRNDKSVDACCACATGYGSGWWFDNCSEANLNGIYHDTPLGHNYVGIVWEHWHGDYSLKKARMLIRPKYDDSEREVATHAMDEYFIEDP